MRAKNLEGLLSFAVKNRFPVLIKGKPGIGKSDIVEQACKSAGAELIISHPVVADPTDYKGLPFVVNGKADFLPFGDLERLVNADTLTVYFLDDLGQASPSVQAACMQLLLARRVNGHKVSENVTFVAATNRREDRAAVAGLLEPVKSRFASIVELEVNTDDWVAWALSHDMPTELISFIQWRPELLDKFEATRDIINSPCPRTVAYCGKMQRAGIPYDLMYEVFKGAVGEAFAIEYMAFLKMSAQLPTAMQVIMDPTGTIVPSDISALFAITGALVEKLTTQTMAPIMTYLNRLPKEFAAKSIKAAAIKTPAICSTREFISFASQNSDLFV